MDMFPRIYALATSKSGYVRSFGKWEDRRWTWEIALCRRAFGWEVDVWDEFMRSNEGFVPVEETRDKIIWAPSSSRRFTCIFFRRSISKKGLVSDRWKILWGLSVLLKVKCFVWLYLRDRVTVRNRLFRSSVIQEDGNVCSICG